MQPNRRQFLRSAVLASAAAPLVTSATAEEKKQPLGSISASNGAGKVGGFYLGSQCWTFNRFSVIEAIEFTARSGGTVCEFFPGQKLAKDGDAKFDHNATPEQLQQVAEALGKWKVIPMNYGVVGVPNDEAGARKIFEFARHWKLYGITTESTESLDLLEKLAKEYQIRVCFHNHPQQPNNPNYKVWNPQYILDITRDRDPLLGACADTGHWIRSGLNALDSLKLLGKRVLSMHLKDRTDEKSEDKIFGTGKANVVAMLEQVRSTGFAGNVSIEYETNWDHSLPDVSQCIGFIRAAGELKGWA